LQPGGIEGLHIVDPEGIEYKNSFISQIKIQSAIQKYSSLIFQMIYFFLFYFNSPKIIMLAPQDQFNGKKFIR